MLNSVNRLLLSYSNKNPTLNFSFLGSDFLVLMKQLDFYLIPNFFNISLGIASL